MQQIIKSFCRLRLYCEAQHFKGWDPYDGLNSRLFQSLPLLKKSALCRLVVIQGFKRSPVNLRRPALVPKEHNPKGIGLFLSAYTDLYRLVEVIGKQGEALFGSLSEIEGRITQLAELLISLQSNGYSGACWGYNFDWQARRLFLFPKYTPTVVATNFCATALMHAYEITKEKRYLDVALSAADFVIKDLHRTPYKNGFLFSYSPLPGNDTVFNASLLGSRLLSHCYHYTHKEEYKKLAEESVNACCAAQREDGAWVYGMLPVQNWVDSFHTGYNLEALNSYRTLTGDDSFNPFLEQGLKYYLANFWQKDGTPKYYNNKTFPIDIHCPAQLLITLCNLKKLDQYRNLAENVLAWTLNHMQDNKGYFYYQLKPIFNTKIPYMRWSNAFMMKGLSTFLLHSLPGKNQDYLKSRPF